jgi:hypothetical protein
MSVACWTEVAGGDITQGDWIPVCNVPSLPDEIVSNEQLLSLRLQTHDLIVITHGCDLVNQKAGVVTFVQDRVDHPI